MLNIITAQSTGFGDIISMALPFLIMIAALYFFIIMPQQRDEKRRKEMVENLKKGDKVITESGIVGTVIDKKDDEIVLEISAGIPVRFKKWAIRGLAKDGKKG